MTKTRRKTRRTMRRQKKRRIKIMKEWEKNVGVE